MKKALLFSLLILVALADTALSLDTPVVLEQGKDEYLIGTSVRWLEDPGGRLTIDEVRGVLSSRFRRSTDRVLNFGYTRSAHWLSFTVRNQTAQTGWFLEIPYTLLDHIDLYSETAPGKFTPRKAGRMVPFSQKEIRNRKFTFGLQIDPGAEKTYYLRVASKDSKPVPLRIVHPGRLFFINHYDQLMLGLYYGFILVMILYNLFIFFTIKDTNYLCYVFVLLCMHLFFQLSLNGLSFEIIGRSSLWWSRDSIAFFVSAGILFSVIFAMNFLKTREKMPLAHRFLVGCAGWALLEMALPFFVDYYWAIQSAVIVSMTAGALLGVIGLISLLRGNRAARFYLLSWVPIIFGGLVYGLKVWGLIPSNTLTEYGYQAGSAVQAALLSLALGDNINMLRQEKFAAQQSLLEKERAEREAQERFSQELERLVKERTDALNTTLVELKKRDRILQDELNLAADIQQGLLPHTPYNSNGVRICAYYNAMEKIGGDFFDIFTLSNNYLCVLISDASGHGIPAAFVTAMAKISFHDVSQTSKYPGQIFFNVNDQLLRSLKTQDYLTAFMTVISPSYEVFYANASHPRPLLYRARTAEFEEWDTPGLFIGAIDGQEQKYEDRQDFLDFGDRLFLFTDGLPEARNSQGEEFGVGSIRRIIAENAHRSIDELKDRMVKEWKDFTAGAEVKDDMTFLIIEIDPRYRDLLEHKSMGLTHRYHNNFSDAIQEFELALGIDPAYLPVRQMLGSCYYETKEFEKAVGHLLYYLDRNPEDADAWQMIAASYFNVTNYESAAEAAKKACQLRQNFVRAYEIWGMALAKLDRNDEAAPVWKQLQKIDPHNISAIAGLQKIRDSK